MLNVWNQTTEYREAFGHGVDHARIKPLKDHSYTRCSATVFRYAVADFACEISFDDVTGEYAVALHYPGRIFHFITDSRALDLPAKIIKRYPARGFTCLADY